MGYVKSFRDLEVYLLSRQLSKEIFEITKMFPKDEMNSLTVSIAMGLSPWQLISAAIIGNLKSQSIFPDYPIT